MVDIQMRCHSKITFFYFCFLNLVLINNNFAQTTLNVQSLQDTSDQQEVKIIDGRTNHQIQEQLMRYELEDLTFNQNENELFQKINFKDENNRSLTIEQCRGKVVILHFWATWCGNCINEMKELNEFAKKIHNQEMSDKVIIIPISIDSQSNVVRQFYNQKHLNHLKIYQDANSSYFHKLGLSSVPYTFIIDQNGKKVKKISGPIDWSGNPNIMKQIQSLAK